MEQMECRFCKLVRTGKKTWYKDEWISVFFDIDPISKGHILIVPNQHFLDIDELPSAVLHRVFQCSQVYVKLLKEKLGPKGYSIMQNGGAFNDMGHFHLHVFPRFNEADFGWTYTDEQTEEALDFQALQNLFQVPLNNLMKEKNR